MANNYTQFSFMLPAKGEEGKTAETVLDAYARKMDQDDEELGFEYTADPAGIWINSGPESGNPDNVIVALQAVLQNLGTEKGVWFSWANTCSKLRLDEFGGGGAVVTAHDVIVTLDYDCQETANTRGIKLMMSN